MSEERRTVDYAEVGRQLQCPNGEFGIKVAAEMNLANAQLSRMAMKYAGISSGNTVLEIGFGNGAFLTEYFALADNLHVYGVDLSMLMCREAVQRNTELLKSGVLHLCCSDCCRLPFANNSFDAIVTVNTLYFWPDCVAQCREFLRVLKPGGRLSIGFRQKEVMRFLPFVETGFTLYDFPDLHTQLSNAGFTVYLQEEIAGVPYPPENPGPVLPDACMAARKPV